MRQPNLRYSAQNLYCRITILNLDPTEIINFNLTKSQPNRSDEYALEIYYIDGSQRYQTFDNAISLKQDISVSKYIFHYFSSSDSNIIPYIAEVSVSANNFTSTSLIGIIVAGIIILLICAIGFVVFYKCSKEFSQARKRQLRRIQMFEHNQAEYPNSNNPENVMTSTISQAPSMSEASYKRNKLKKALTKLFETSLKPRKNEVGNNEFNVTECTICLEEFDSKSNVTKLLCKHVFHFECIVDWIKKQRSEIKCPNCNLKIIPDELMNDSIDQIEIHDTPIIRIAPQSENQPLNPNNEAHRNNLVLASNHHASNNNFIGANDRHQRIHSNLYSADLNENVSQTDNIQNVRGRTSTFTSLGQAIIINNSNAINQRRITQFIADPSTRRNLLEPQVSVNRNLELNREAYRLNMQ